MSELRKQTIYKYLDESNWFNKRDQLFIMNRHLMKNTGSSMIKLRHSKDVQIFVKQYNEQKNVLVTQRKELINIFEKDWEDICSAKETFIASFMNYQSPTTALYISRSIYNQIKNFIFFEGVVIKNSIIQAVDQFRVKPSNLCLRLFQYQNQQISESQKYIKLGPKKVDWNRITKLLQNQQVVNQNIGDLLLTLGYTGGQEIPTAQST